MKQFGLTDKQAEESRQKYGDNSMTEQASESFWDKLKGNLGDPMIKILIVALLINVVLAVLGGVGIIKEGAPGMVRASWNFRGYRACNAGFHLL